MGWGDVNDLMINGKVAMMIMGDWTPGVLWSKGFKDFGWAPAPGNDGVYQMLSDSFGLPKNVKNREAALNFLKIVGSKEGQDAFNPAKGSIPARTDADPCRSTRTTTRMPWTMEEGQDRPEHRPRRCGPSHLHDRLHERHQRLRHEEGRRCRPLPRSSRQPMMPDSRSNPTATITGGGVAAPVSAPHRRLAQVTWRQGRSPFWC